MKVYSILFSSHFYKFTNSPLNPVHILSFFFSFYPNSRYLENHQIHIIFIPFCAKYNIKINICIKNNLMGIFSKGLKGCVFYIIISNSFSFYFCTLIGQSRFLPMNIVQRYWVITIWHIKVQSVKVTFMENNCHYFLI